MKLKDGLWRIGAVFQVLSSICQYSDVCPTSNVSATSCWFLSGLNARTP